MSEQRPSGEDRVGASREMIAATWHDVTCPEGNDCRSRWEHANSAPLITSGVLERFVDELRRAFWFEQWKAQRIAAGDWPPDPNAGSGKVDDPERIRAWRDTGKWDPK